MGIAVRFDNVVVDYPHLFAARLYKGKYKYQLTILFDKDGPEHRDVEAAFEQLRLENPGKQLDPVLYDGDAKCAGNPAYTGKMFIRVSRNQDQGPPPVYGLVPEEGVLDVITGTPLVKRGSIMNCVVDAYVPKSPNDDKICWGFQGVQFVRDGEPIFSGGEVAPETLFKPLTTETKKPSFL